VVLNECPFLQNTGGTHPTIQNSPPLRNTCTSSIGEIVVHIDQLCDDNVPYFITAAG